MKHLLFSMIFIVAAINYVKAAVNDEVTIPEIKFSIEHTLPCQAIMADGSRHSVPPKLIDYIEFSKVDSLGFEHSGYVSQIIHLKDSSLIILPIADIKSFEFQTPPTKYADGVTVIDRDGLWEHVLKSEGNSFLLDTSTPLEIIPKVGQRLVTLRTDGAFPCGFSGEVESLSSCSDGTTLVICKYVNQTETVLEHTETVMLRSSADDKPASRGHTVVPLPGSFILPLNEILVAAGLESPSAYPGQVSLSFPQTFNFTKLLYLDIFYTNTITYGDILTDITVNYVNSTTLDISGAFSFEGTCKLLQQYSGDSFKIKPIPLGTSGLEFYLELDIPISVNMDIVGNGLYEDKKTYRTGFFYSSNPNIKSSIKKIEYNEYKNNSMQLNTNFTLSIGPEAEFGVRNIGYDNPFGDMGFRWQNNLSTGVKFEGSDYTPYENSSVSTKFYDDKVDLCKIAAGLFLDFSSKIHAGVKIGKGDDGDKKWEWVLLDLPILEYKPDLSVFWQAKKYPYFASPSLNLRSSESSSDKYSYKINTPLVSPVRVGYSIIDDNTNEALYSEYSSERYDGKIDEPQNIEFEVPVIASILGRKATIYPLVKPGESEDSWWEKEVLASPGVPIKVDIIPITGESDGVYISEATVYGTIERYFYLLNSKGHECGFLYSTGNVDSSSPKVKCTLGTKDISAKLSNLKPGTKYYYAAYVKIEDKYIIGKVKNFTTREDEFVDLGLSVKWCFKNVGAQNETDYGNLYAWGETITKSSYVWDNYFDSPYDSEGNVVGCRNKTDDIAGDKEYDVVTSTMPGTRMPTKDEMRELINQCDWNWTAVNGVSGYRITSKVNSNSIFLPAAGIQDGSSCENEGTYGGYWTGTVGSSSTKMTAVNLYFTSQTKSTQQGNRYVGRSIRAVMP